MIVIKIYDSIYNSFKSVSTLGKNASEKDLVIVVLTSLIILGVCILGFIFILKIISEILDFLDIDFLDFD